jgi:hypothetical protein
VGERREEKRIIFRKEAKQRRKRIKEGSKYDSL